jgi:hypothetical protein
MKSWCLWLLCKDEYYALLRHLLYMPSVVASAVGMHAQIFSYCLCCCCKVVLTSEVTPPQTNGWKVTVAGILLLLLMASCVQLSLVANITKLPKVRAALNSML